MRRSPHPHRRSPLEQRPSTRWRLSLAISGDPTRPLTPETAAAGTGTSQQCPRWQHHRTTAARVVGRRAWAARSSLLSSPAARWWSVPTSGRGSPSPSDCWPRSWPSPRARAHHRLDVRVVRGVVREGRPPYGSRSGGRRGGVHRRQCCPGPLRRTGRRPRRQCEAGQGRCRQWSSRHVRFDERRRWAALLAAVTLGGVPENAALGISLGATGGSLALLAAIFASNLPESLVGAASLRAQGKSNRVRSGALVGSRNLSTCCGARGRGEQPCSAARTRPPSAALHTAGGPRAARPLRRRFPLRDGHPRSAGVCTAATRRATVVAGTTPP